MENKRWEQFIPWFYTNLHIPALPDGVEVLNPYNDPGTMTLLHRFCEKYYDDNHKRTLLFGINPGRFGAGVTGICFTDPIRLENHCGIPNMLEKKQELSSVFMYEMMEAMGGPAVFYESFLFTAISPLGFVKEGKNMNYYDIKGWREIFEKFIVATIEQQLKMPVNRDIAFSIGQGTNMKVLSELNKHFKWFSRIETLPHPRWIMQYRLKRKSEFIDEYIQKLWPLSQ